MHQQRPLFPQRPQARCRIRAVTEVTRAMADAIEIAGEMPRLQTIVLRFRAGTEDYNV